MLPQQTALILVGFQNDYFAPEGVLYSVIEESSSVTGVVVNTIRLLEALQHSPVLFVSTPIFFTEGYTELREPIGLLKHIKELGAFQMGKSGSEIIRELRRFGSRIIEVPGKRGFNAFSNTELDSLLRERGIRNLVLAGTCTSICIDSTGRSAHERGYAVTILSDCTSARTVFEQEFYCNEILPLYAEVITHRELLKKLDWDCR